MKKNTTLFWALALFSSSIAAHFDSWHPLSNSYTKAFSVVPQRILPGEAILLEKIRDPSHAINLSFAATSGIILFNRSGTYKIVWYGRTHSPFNRPWILGFSLDNVILLGSKYGNSECRSTFENVEGSIVLSINAGQVLCFVNASSHPIELIEGKSHSHSPLPSFAVCLSLFDPR